MAVNRVVVDFEPDQPFDPVSRGKATSGLGPVLISASHDIVCHAEIERALLFAGQKINAGTVVMDSGLAPSGAPRNDELIACEMAAQSKASQPSAPHSTRARPPRSYSSLPISKMK